MLCIMYDMALPKQYTECRLQYNLILILSYLYYQVLSFLGDLCQIYNIILYNKYILKAYIRLKWFMLCYDGISVMIAKNIMVTHPSI